MASAQVMVVSKNVTTEETFSQNIKLQKNQKLTYADILKAIKNHPNSNNKSSDQDYVQIMYEDKGFWLFMTDDYSKDLSKDLPSMNPNQSKIKFRQDKQNLNVRYKIYHKIS